MRIAALCALLFIAPLAIAQSTTSLWENGPKEKFCGLGTYQDGLDVGFRNATSSFGETLVTVQVLPSFRKEYALVFKRVGAELKLYRVTFQNQLWGQMGPPLHVPKTRQECLGIASAAKVDALDVNVQARDLQELWTAFGNIDLTTDKCPRRGKSCAYFEDGTGYVVQTQDGRSFRITETGQTKRVRSENPALLAWIHKVQEFVSDPPPR